MFEWLTKLFKRETGVADLQSLKPIKYTLNDPTTASLVMSLNPPSPPNGMAFTVLNYKGGGYDPNSVEGQAANDYVTIANAIKLMQTYTAKPLVSWSSTRNLKVIPRAGKDLNAYYDRQNLKFFYMPDPKLNKVVYAADSADVVAHELNHGILDAIRPELFNMQAAEAWAFHEGYADIGAILAILNYKPVIEYMLKETGNDLTKSSVVSRLAEELGTALYDLAGTPTQNCLRNAINNFVYTPPEKLPDNVPDDQLSGECHSFGRLWLGAWFEIFTGFYAYEYAKTNDAYQSVITAKDAAGKYLMQGIAIAPATKRFYDAVARGMLTYAQSQNKPDYLNIMNQVFTKRKILLPKITMLAEKNIKDIKLKNNDEIIHFGDKKVVKVKNTEKVILAQHLGLTAQADNPLFNVEIEIPNDASYEFNAQGMLKQEISCTREEIIDGARHCLNYLHRNNAVGGDKNMWEVVDNKLVRTKFID